MSLRSLQGRLLWTFVTLMTLGLGSVIGLSGMQLNAQTLQRNEDELTMQAQLIANALREPVERESDSQHSGGRSLDVLIGSYAQGVGGRVTLLDSNLQIVFSSDSAVTARIQQNQTELLAARRGEMQPTVRWDEWQKTERLFVAVPVVGEHGQPISFVQLSVPMGPIYAEMTQTWLRFLGIGSVVLLVTAIAGIVIARQIAVPVERLTATTEQIAAGRLDERVTPAGPNEIHRLGTAFNRMTERVQAMMTQQRAFVDNAAHELRSPLTSIRLRIEMLRTRARNNAELTQHYLAQMDGEVGYLQRLVDNLLDLATVENSEHAIPKAPLDLASMLYDVSDEMSVVAQQAGLEFQTDIPEHLPTISANADQMKILIRNLIDNAIKYTQRGGKISLTANSPRGEIEIQVTDTGIGIPAEALPHIFERFYRVDAAHSRDTSRATSSTGLGLALVQRIAQSHGGRAEVSSWIGKGSTFTVRLPIRSDN